MATPCPAVWTAVTGEPVRCTLTAGHEHMLGAAERFEEQHGGRRRDRTLVTWLPD